MAVDPNLLKQAKVYMNKEGEEASSIGPGTGAAIGGIGGAGLAALIAMLNKSRLERMNVMGWNPLTSRAANETANMSITGGLAGAGAGAVGGYLYDQHKKKKKTTKAAKVYDAAESVTDMPVKHVRESHKQCAPGEFGMNKEGKSLRTLVAELAQEKSAYSPHQATMQNGSGRADPLNAINAANAQMPHFAKAHAAGDRRAAQNADMTYTSLMNSASKANQQIGGPAIPVRPLTKTWPLPPAPPAASAPKTKASAWTFGAQVKQALHPALGMAGLGGAGGLIAGGLSGLIAPGEYEDEDGNVKRRGRLSTALQRALTLGAVGAAGGGAYGMYDQAGAGKAVDFARSLYQQLMGGGKKPADPIRVDATMQGDAGSKMPAQPKFDATLLPPNRSQAPSDLGAFGTGQLFGGKSEKAPGSTYSPASDESYSRRSADARHKNTMTFPYGKEIDPLTGEKAVPFNAQR